jgi:ELWxxDGT repeat protein
MLVDLAPGAAGSTPYGFTALDGTIYFVAYAASANADVWRTDGTAEGTRVVRRLCPEGTSCSAPGSLTVF